jgi:hypothetical protein
MRALVICERGITNLLIVDVNVTFHAEKERSTLLDRNDPDKEVAGEKEEKCGAG